MLLITGLTFLQKHFSPKVVSKAVFYLKQQEGRDMSSLKLHSTALEIGVKLSRS